jgi:hypothetical protein
MSRDKLFAESWPRVQKRIESFHGIPVITRDVPDPLTGDLDGAEIHIDHAVSAELRLFLLAHLFGHTVQWNVDPQAFQIGQLLAPPISEAALAPILDYERQAACYSLTLLRESGIGGLDQWLSDFSAADIAYLSHYYRTGEKRDFETFRIPAAPLLEPLAIPVFAPRRVRFRVDGIVI